MRIFYIVVCRTVQKQVHHICLKLFIFYNLQDVDVSSESGSEKGVGASGDAFHWVTRQRPSQ